MYLPRFIVLFVTYVIAIFAKDGKILICLSNRQNFCSFYFPEGTCNVDEYHEEL